ncbi:hypothetical protein CPAR01_00670 [Colletotrichum paranaense]|uniref:Secreted protein n=1 Tax=Colletotrichum paranaense TaxID=1914294 RepID=A0ABQ9T4J9_9PEZI|nr:uncharacterized protein CPAR01_00670 [Colletotrichum paranaense]KAK1546703.1 hypothetical protein CPAR01_00670 [Colletotrichum paranaense]
MRFLIVRAACCCCCRMRSCVVWVVASDVTTCVCWRMGGRVQLFPLFCLFRIGIGIHRAVGVGTLGTGRDFNNWRDDVLTTWVGENKKNRKKRNNW